jgi:hypothetical protein
MKCLPILICVFSCQVLAADFKDPMKPPTYALKMFRLEKIKKNNSFGKSSISQKKKEPVWVLKSILYSRQRQHAIINNRLVRKGDVIKGAKLIRLRPDSVRLLAKGQVIDLDLRSRYESVRKSPAEKKL